MLNRKNTQYQKLNMTPLRFGLFWSGYNLSFLRFLTFKTLRHFHPEEEIILYISKKFKKSIVNWNYLQDFQYLKCNNYIDKLDELNIKIVETDIFNDFLPNFQADLFRWWFLHEFGGFYVDLDFIFVRSLKNFPLDNNLIYSQYKTKTGGIYSPTSIIGANNSEIIKIIKNNTLKYYNENNYNSLGSYLFEKNLNYNCLDKKNNCEHNIFYPISDENFIESIFRNNVKLPTSTFAIHWYGGKKISQKFNETYNESYILRSNDTISENIKKIL